MEDSTAHEEAERTRAALLHGLRQAKLAHAISCGVAGREMPESVQADPLAPVAYTLGMTFLTSENGPDALLLMEAMTRYLGHGPLCIRGVYVDDLWPRPEPDDVSDGNVSSEEDPDEPDAPPAAPDSDEPPPAAP